MQKSQSLAVEEQEQILIEGDRYAIEHHWCVQLIPQLSIFAVYQPWLKGFMGEYQTGISKSYQLYGYEISRMWSDK